MLLHVSIHRYFACEASPVRHDELTEIAIEIVTLPGVIAKITKLPDVYRRPTLRFRVDQAAEVIVKGLNDIPITRFTT